MFMSSNEDYPLDKLSVYADYYSLQDDECLNAIHDEIGNYSPEDDYKIIVAEKLNTWRKIRLGKYATSVVADPGGKFTIQAWFNSIRSKSTYHSPPTLPRLDHMSPDDIEIMERFIRGSRLPVFKSAFHPDFDIK